MNCSGSVCVVAVVVALTFLAMGNNQDETGLVESGFTAGACDVDAVQMMCDLTKLTTAQWKDLLEWVGQEQLHLEHKVKLNEFQGPDERADDFEHQHLPVGQELNDCIGPMGVHVTGKLNAVVDKVNCHIHVDDTSFDVEESLPPNELIEK